MNYKELANPTVIKADLQHLSMTLLDTDAGLGYVCGRITEPD